MTLEVIHGDMLAELPKLAADGERFHSVVTDPPYHLTSIVKRFGKEGSAPAKHGTDGAFARVSKGFMGKQWDGGDISYKPETWRAVYDVMLPGAYLVAFASTRGYHRMACAIEDAGFVIHPMLAFMFGTGFPKATDASKQINRHLGAVREIVDAHPMPEANGKRLLGIDGGCGLGGPCDITAPATPEAAAWEGWKYGLQSLKPAIEPIALCQRPMEVSGAQNILKYGVGALNIGASRVPTSEADDIHTKNPHTRSTSNGFGEQRIGATYNAATGRYPANLIHDGSPEVLASFAAFGEARSAGDYPSGSTGTGNGVTYMPTKKQGTLYSDSGSPARFFYSAKADTADRADSRHPTVKPVDLVRYLVRLVTPPGGRILDPFAGTGTTGEAAMLLGMDCTMIERDAQHVADIHHRIARWSGGDLPMFADSPVAADPQDERIADLFAEPQP